MPTSIGHAEATLIDVGKVARDAFADAFRRVTGRPLAALPQLVGRSDTEIFFESLYLNDVPVEADQEAELLARYSYELENAFYQRRRELATDGRLLAGARLGMGRLRAEKSNSREK